MRCLDVSDKDFWAWYVDPLKCEKGWGVHRDRQQMPFEEDGTGTLLFLEIPRIERKNSSRADLLQGRRITRLVGFL
jgi:hypothetical protein